MAETDEPRIHSKIPASVMHRETKQLAPKKSLTDKVREHWLSFWVGYTILIFGAGFAVSYWLIGRPLETENKKLREKLVEVKIRSGKEQEAGYTYVFGPTWIEGNTSVHVPGFKMSVRYDNSLSPMRPVFWIRVGEGQSIRFELGSGRRESETFVVKGEALVLRLREIDEIRGAEVYILRKE